VKAEYIQHVGSDLTVVNAARVSFDKESEWEAQEVEVPVDCHPTTISLHRLAKRDEKLIGYLAKHGHWTPFSHCFVTLRETVPIFVARQRFKHMVGFSYNEVSRRYVDSEPTFFTPTSWRRKADNKKQGSSDETVDLAGYSGSGVFEDLDHQFKSMMALAQNTYEELLAAGVCPEQARMVLPQSMYTSYYVSGSLAAWARMYKQRMDPHAQKEIQDLAQMVGDVVAPLFPVSWKTLTE
jgi:thymidylate synthase (FAD)